MKNICPKKVCVCSSVNTPAQAPRTSSAARAVDVYFSRAEVRVFPFRGHARPARPPLSPHPHCALGPGPPGLQAWESRPRAAPSWSSAPFFLPRPDGRTSGGCGGATPETEVSSESERQERRLEGFQSELKMNTRGLGSQLKDSIPVTELSASGPFENHDLLRKGFSCVKNELLPSHPLELSEKNFQLNQDKMNFSTLRNIQGLFAPLKLQMEFKAVQQIAGLTCGGAVDKASTWKC
ncbi:proteasome maturation protein isoform X3 [Saccopteryx leptura]|uniref:proteasome maturation protein isoform X3 n=1 Tax=Saccopteryx leptura TaxID=249018 RepID=UPI00339C0545